MRAGIPLKCVFFKIQRLTSICAVVEVKLFRGRGTLATLVNNRSRLSASSQSCHRCDRDPRGSLSPASKVSHHLAVTYRRPELRTSCNHRAHLRPARRLLAVFVFVLPTISFFYFISLSSVAQTVSATHQLLNTARFVVIIIIIIIIIITIIIISLHV
jgi:hypothetical protein